MISFVINLINVYFLSTFLMNFFKTNINYIFFSKIIILILINIMDYSFVCNEFHDSCIDVNKSKTE
jgi:hypothetical protein